MNLPTIPVGNVNGVVTYCDDGSVMGAGSGCESTASEEEFTTGMEEPKTSSAKTSTEMPITTSGMQEVSTSSAVTASVTGTTQSAVTMSVTGTQSAVTMSVTGTQSAVTASAIDTHSPVASTGIEITSALKDVTTSVRIIETTTEEDGCKRAERENKGKACGKNAECVSSHGKYYCVCASNHFGNPYDFNGTGCLQDIYQNRFIAGFKMKIEIDFHPDLDNSGTKAYIEAKTFYEQVLDKFYISIRGYIRRSVQVVRFR